MKGFRVQYSSGEMLKVEFRCAGCDVRSEWVFYAGMYRYLDQYCPACSSLLWYLRYLHSRQDKGRFALSEKKMYESFSELFFNMKQDMVF